MQGGSGAHGRAEKLQPCWKDKGFGQKLGVHHDDPGESGAMKEMWLFPESLCGRSKRDRNLVALVSALMG